MVMAKTHMQNMARGMVAAKMLNFGFAPYTPGFVCDRDALV